ncbi:peroxidase 55-like [Tasmannia lanceolata]|uniref:peroxidase 55-like n=1 Tax=Tasmannia lanceolata TaxID=3420 RepID=UPI0040643B51
MEFMLVSIFFILSSCLFANSDSSGLSVNFYGESCPDMEELIKPVMERKIMEGKNITAPATLRLFFHDCFVEGCDGSVLISSTEENKAERDADINLSLAGDGFDVVVQAKKVLEEACPGVVSCADILAVLARDASVVSKGPSWEVPKGRRDSRSSSNETAAAQLPSGESNLTQLVHMFQSKGLNLLDLVTLSGAHTIGSAHCKEFEARLSHNDSTIDPAFRDELMRNCPLSNINPDVVQRLDLITNLDFDNFFYQNLEKGKGLLTSDQELFSGSAESRELVSRYAQNQTFFFSAFASSMVKFGKLGVLTGSQGEIRKDCTKIN